ncbi:hypothetical protein HYALB_00004860 [Hymenoscyphus albidus]|uniref:Biotrophy-associated secreted protein 2 n=1 Tax=Hymenoscyphus albidus TaxID=595503 RepID=A0A9N9LY46_9HELO|nr:hypothetical protein HYALB_00004860 [Hymenoscyphus albidus]
MPSPSQKMILSTFLLLNLTLPVLSAGTQFITGACTSDADCAAGCCGFNTAKCAGPIIALQRDGGCGFGSGTPNDNAAKAMGFTGGITSAKGSSTGAGTGTGTSPSPAVGAAAAKGTQFITGPCTSDADCAAGCCGFNTGKCAGPIIALQRDGGCGFGGTPNDNAAKAMGFTGGITSASKGTSGTSTSGGTTPSPAVAATAAKGTQFITGPCTSDADCAAGCCGFNSGKCAGPIIAQQRDGGCGFGDKTPNDDAAKKLRGAKRGIRGWNL